MPENVYDELKARGFIAQVSDEEAVRRMIGGERVTFYIGFDGTAESLHAGSLVPIMAMMHLKRAGHRPIAIVGGGTTMVGDPSGRTEMRRILDEETIRAFGRRIQDQLDRYLHFDGDASLALDNADWLLSLNYIAFLRDIGRHFSVNRMLTAEAYKLRLEKGLSFIEFNYQLLQAYDYLVLFRRYGCRLQMGGDDQWGNILAGVDLIRRVESAQVEALTFPLLTTAGGAKMGKTAEGAVWLDAGMFSPYDYYQYWINCDDRDVGRFLKLYTLLSLDEIAGLAPADAGAEALRAAKRILAFEATKITHGENAAAEARAASEAAFGGAGDVAALPTTVIAADRLKAGVGVVDLIVESGLTSSRGEAKRLIQQGGITAGETRVDALDRVFTDAEIGPEGILLRAGKKKVRRILAG
ncbi:MAG: tyrosine--tRNA ligase [Acidobacteriota bacterium]|nr:tyrosine--tRNA ligase [Acidobacteriota bacterium]